MALMATAYKYDIQIELMPTQARFGFANSQTSEVCEKARVWLPTVPACYTDFDIIEEGSVPLLFSLGQMCNLYFTLSMTPEIVYLTCAAFGYYDYPVNRSTTKHLVLNLAEIKKNPAKALSLPTTKYDPVSFGVFPDSQEMKAQEDQEETKSKETEAALAAKVDKGKEKTSTSKDEAAPAKEDTKGVPSAEDALPANLRKLHEKLKDNAELLKLHLKHYHMSTAQFRRRTSALKIPEIIYQQYDEIVKKCRTCMENSAAPVRARVRVPRAHGTAAAPPSLTSCGSVP